MLHNSYMRNAMSTIHCLLLSIGLVKSNVSALMKLHCENFYKTSQNKCDKQHSKNNEELVQKGLTKDKISVHCTYSYTKDLPRERLR